MKLKRTAKLDWRVRPVGFWLICEFVGAGLKVAVLIADLTFESQLDAGLPPIYFRQSLVDVKFRL